MFSYRKELFLCEYFGFLPTVVSTMPTKNAFRLKLEMEIEPNNNRHFKKNRTELELIYAKKELEWNPCNHRNRTEAESSVLHGVAVK